MIVLPLLFACTEPGVDTTLPVHTDEPIPELVPNGAAPDFQMDIQDGTVFTLSEHAGDVILVDLSGFF